MIRQRFVGFVVIAALIIIFLPIVFVAPQEEDQLVLPAFEMPLKPSLQASPRVQPAINIVDETQLPSSPRKETYAQQPLDVAVLRADGVLAEADFQPRQQSSARERAKFDEQGLPISWALQVAALSSEWKAEEIAQFLRNKKYKAYVSSVYLENQELFRVMIGPSLQKTRLDEFKVLLDEYFLVDSVIVPFSVDG
ncbi:SPOR domain-containing protein [Luminiphilus sp.]|nr:SPOR domain-containing protein [Luminiphilus sp.]MDB3899283.1 SPOR domain-containing protein [Luminiphilus sp.]